MFPNHVCRFLFVLLVASALASSSGCLVTTVRWHQPNYLPALKAEQIVQSGALGRAERIYAKAQNFEECCRASCVDLYFEVARLTAGSAGNTCYCRGRQLHEAALMKMVVTGQRFKRFDPALGLTIQRKGQTHSVPITRHGFVWEASDFDRLIPIGFYDTSAIRQKQQRRGYGVPFVVERRDDPERPFLRKRGAFSSTLVMRCDSGDRCNGEDSNLGCRIELYDPLRTDSIEIDGRPKKIAKDTTAPMVYMLQGQQWTYLNYFINPRSGPEQGSLYTLEPYQRNKIPLVLIHGLLSDPFTWVELANQLIVHPGFMDHFQIWAFEYSTGDAFLVSATDLREQLASCRQYHDPLRGDPQLSDMILVGHSMGGLIAKLQVTSSGDQLWNSIASRSLDELRLPDTIRGQFQRYFYFEPSPDIGRVVFMATPHQGSSFASGPAGRLSSKLINMPEEETQRHDLIVRCNPGVFTKEFRNRVPTSIDLLNPHSELLSAIGSLPAAEHVCMHSIVGNRCWTLLQGKSDGIVPVSSAREPRAVSEKIVSATHTELKGHPEAVKEILYILQEHLRRSHGFSHESTAEFEPTVTLAELSVED